MRWFRRGRGRAPDPWDTEENELAGDIEAVRKIRSFCDAASEIARIVGNGLGGPVEKKRYERAAKAAMHAALKIADDPMRDAALRRIIDLCVSANHLKTAQTLLGAIQTVSIREVVLKEHPVLRP